MNIVSHMEHYLGKIAEGWCDKGNRTDNIQVVRFENKLFDSVNTYASLGLSDHELTLKPQKKARLEFLLMFYDVVNSDLIVNLIFWLCDCVLKEHQAVKRGELVSLPSEVKNALGIEAIYFTMPVYCDEGLHIFFKSNPDTIVVWGVPIKSEEKSYIESNGWEAFEDILEQKDPDLCDLQRNSIV